MRPIGRNASPHVARPSPLPSPRNTGEREIILSRDGFGAKIELDKPLLVQRGANDTILIRLIDKPAAVDQIAIGYDIVPFATR